MEIDSEIVDLIEMNSTNSPAVQCLALRYYANPNISWSDNATVPSLLTVDPFWNQFYVSDIFIFSVALKKLAPKFRNWPQKALD